jgi:hypothetical protein
MLSNVAERQLISLLSGEVALDKVIVHRWPGLAVLPAFLPEHALQPIR